MFVIAQESGIVYVTLCQEMKISHKFSHKRDIHSHDKFLSLICRNDNQRNNTITVPNYPIKIMLEFGYRTIVPQALSPTQRISTTREERAELECKEVTV